MNLPRIDNKNLHNETHIWIVDLDQWNLSCLEAVQTLPETEAKKAGRFRFETHRNRYIKGHFMLRSLIGMYLDIDFYDQEFHANRYGKPAMQTFHENNSIHFNISNSENIYVCAFREKGEIGIDIERIHDLPDMDQIVERFFSFDEKKVFRSLQEQNRKHTFFRYWTRKEALLKAMGVGLSFPLNQVDVHAENNCSSPVFTKSIGMESLISDLNIFNGFAAAIALEDKHTDYNTRLLYITFDNKISENLPMKNHHNSNIFFGAAETLAFV
ncbi:MAG: hypothetical protein CVU51_01225 [Deltaproteobacteria bacterium HGW-Deltaproteobacteria-1]|jgi:4'-phosphopantetheinyl transferase|nr:MAG: hypothetical protein CVU51_01225 [Deltaproteobacteria bacterium HGW-Deltaproteobacteria-1]